MKTGNTLRDPPARPAPQELRTPVRQNSKHENHYLN